MKELFVEGFLYSGTTIGPTAGLDPESYIHSKYIVIWACNSVSTNLHHWSIVQDAKKGAKVVVIDSYKSRTAKQADWHIEPKPGSDGAYNGYYKLYYLK